MDMTPQTWPEWYDGRHINEVLFCQQFLDKHPMKCVRGRLFTVDGLIEDEGQIGNLILEEISGCLTSGLSKVVANLLASIKLQAYSPPLPIETDRIHVANGTYFMNGSFTADKSYCNNRLTVAYNPDAPTPKKWLQFLSKLLQPEDIPTLQEFLGYCLLPTTKGQKMLMLIGKGGEGKSRIGLVMRSLLGDSMNTTSIQKVESNRFSRADLENKLLMVDDDMDMSALPKTNYIKSIVTSECKMDMERKGIQSYTELVQEIRGKSKERKSLLAQKKETPFYLIPKQCELSRHIAELTEELEDLKSEKNMLLHSLECSDDAGIAAVKKDISTVETALKKLSQQEEKYTAELNDALRQYAELKEQSAEFDPDELQDARLALRPAMERSAVDRVQSAYGDKYDLVKMYDSKRDVSDILHEEAETRSIRERLRQKQQQQPQQKQNKKKSRDTLER